MTQTQAGQNPLLAQLQWVHDMVRRDLAAVRDLAREAARGAPAPGIQEGLLGLRTRGGLFQLRVNCLRYCAFVHEHHTNEDVALFPAVRRSAPQLGATVDRLEADHRVVAGLLDEIEATARTLDGDDTAARTRLVDALETLSAHLLEHLAFEEQALAPVLASWKAWPFHG
ncbi:hemerythrin domain-containing protein [Dactylosporangium sp. NBC_01737]|uniref:hemerythrin domain-containing protein n=1 Tax=Dactylosporangium sp. NBC_01737 TaxID=2975959 RepID=UPI002E119FAF|nr:hemerythrin domain-containing protein [Dactylosporangium sp. NBC_01737]